MGIRARDIAWSYGDKVPAAAHRALLAIAELCYKDKLTTSKPIGQRLLAEKLKRSQSATSPLIATCVEAGILTVDKGADGHSQRFVYTIVSPLTDQDGGSVSEISESKTDRLSDPTDQDGGSEPIRTGVHVPVYSGGAGTTTPTSQPPAAAGAPPRFARRRPRGGVAKPREKDLKPKAGRLERSPHLSGFCVDCQREFEPDEPSVVELGIYWMKDKSGGRVERHALCPIDELLAIYSAADRGDVADWTERDWYYAELGFDGDDDESKALDSIETPERLRAIAQHMTDGFGRMSEMNVHDLRAVLAEPSPELAAMWDRTGLRAYIRRRIAESDG